MSKQLADWGYATTDPCGNRGKCRVGDRYGELSSVKDPHNTNINISVVSTDYWTLLNAPQIPNIYVPDTSVSAYKTASGWSKWAAYIRPISEMVEN